MINTIKNKIPNKLKKLIRPMYKRIIFRTAAKYDKNQYSKFSYELYPKYSYNNLRAKITFHYHGIEKGLSNVNMRYNFGEKAFIELFKAMDKFLELGYPTDDERFQQAISVIKCYVKIHKENNRNVENIEIKLNEYLEIFNSKYESVGGSITKYKKDLPDFSEVTFKELLNERHSVRDFGSDEILEDDVAEAINLAKRAPSACNRQPWRAYYIKDENLIKKTLKLQTGFLTTGKNTKGLVVVTSNKEYFNGPHERNQSFIDGGMYAATLSYSLTYKNIASCPLHADFLPKRETEIRRLLNISEAEHFICFFAIGSYPDEYKIANSPREYYSKEDIIISNKAAV